MSVPVMKSDPVRPDFLANGTPMRASEEIKWYLLAVSNTAFRLSGISFLGYRTCDPKAPMETALAPIKPATVTHFLMFGGKV